jgi:hypothetical protein
MREREREREREKNKNGYGIWIDLEMLLAGRAGGAGGRPSCSKASI